MSHYSFYLRFIKTKCQTKKAQIQLSSLIIIFEIYGGGLQSYLSDIEHPHLSYFLFAYAIICWLWL